jgi:dienelactone hydrolase
MRPPTSNAEPDRPELRMSSDRAALKTMAERLTSQDCHVLLPDLYHHVGKHVHFEPAVMMQPETMGEMRKRIGNLTSDMLMSDVAACLDVLASRANVDATRVGAVGYCMGGRNAFIAATRFPDRLRTMASIHPGGIVTADPASPHLQAGTVQARMYFGICSTPRSSIPTTRWTRSRSASTPTSSCACTAAPSSISRSSASSCTRRTAATWPSWPTRPKRGSPISRERLPALKAALGLKRSL